MFMLVVEDIFITASVLECGSIIKFEPSPAFRPTVAGIGTSPLVDWYTMENNNT